MTGLPECTPHARGGFAAEVAFSHVNHEIRLFRFDANRVAGTAPAVNAAAPLVKAFRAAPGAVLAREARPITNITHDAFLALVNDCKSPSTAPMSPLAAWVSSRGKSSWLTVKGFPFSH